MNFDLRETLLTAVTTLTFLVGIALVLSFDPTWTIVGIILIGVSGIAFVFDVIDIIANWRETREE